MKDPILNEVDYMANRLAKGTMPGNAKYIFSKDDWLKFKQALELYIAKRENEARQGELANLTQRILITDVREMGAMTLIEKRLAELEAEETK